MNRYYHQHTLEEIQKGTDIQNKIVTIPLPDWICNRLDVCEKLESSFWYRVWFVFKPYFKKNEN